MNPPRVGLVLGAGGVVGHAFHAGVLAALQEHTGWDPRRAEVVVGTSAGSVVGALLRAGLAAPDLAARSLGHPLSAEGAELLARAATSSARPLPRGRTAFPGMAASPQLLIRSALAPWRARPGALLAGALPRGRVPAEVVSTWLGPLFPAGWPDQPLWICAARLSDGRRTIFGRHGSPPAAMADAVAASCAVPGLFSPVDVGGADYVDGGIHSPTNADVLAGRPLDVVIVSSPMSAARPLGASLAMTGRRLHRITLASEIRSLRRHSVPVVTFQPTAADRSVMGINAMDPRRRSAVTASALTSAAQNMGRPSVAEAIAALRH